MIRRTDKTRHTLLEIQAGTNIEPQISDEIIVTDLNAPIGENFDWIAGDTTADDALYTLDEVPYTADGRWRRGGSNLLAGDLNVPFSALFDNTEEPNIDVTVAGTIIGNAYAIGIVSGLPDGVELELEQEVPLADTLRFIVKNNSGATLTAGNAVVNVYEVGK